jgi:MFS family permease
MALKGRRRGRQRFEPMQQAPTSPRDTPWRALVAPIGSISVFGLASRLAFPLVSLRLVRAGAPAAVIAVMAALPALGTIGISFALPALARRCGAKPLLVAAILLSAAGLLVLATPYLAVTWMLSRLAMGMSAGILFALGEARVLEISSDAARGRWTGVYASTLTTCQFAGPALLVCLGTDSAVPILVAVGLHALSLILLANSRWHSALPQRGDSLAWRQFVRDCLPLGAAVLFFSMFDSTMLALLPVYGLRLGLGSREALLLVTAVFLGDACLQIPIGWGADRFGRRWVHALCALLCAGAALALALGLMASATRWPCLLVMGGTAGALYTLAIVRLGDRFSGNALISANAFVGLLWGAGSLGGPLLGSLSMGVFAPHGLMLFVAAGALAVLVAMLQRGTREGRALTAG